MIKNNKNKIFSSPYFPEKEKNMNIPMNYLPAFGKVFSPLVMNNLAEYGYSGYLSEVCSNSGVNIDTTKSVKQFLEDIYDILQKNYRYEYVYKNVIANKILLGKHSLKNAHMLTEFRVGKSKADVVILNGTSTVYEIKSEYDSFVRLNQQIHSYLDIFDFINVITTNSQAEKLKSLLPVSVGLLVLNKNNIISTVRTAKSNINNIKLEILYESLRKAEYTRIIKEYYGSLPVVPNTVLYKVCKTLFCQIPKKVAHTQVVKVLRERTNSETLRKFLTAAPDSMTAYAMSICMEKTRMEQLIDRFELSVDSIMNTN